MGKRGVILLVLVISLAVISFSGIFDNDSQIMEVSQVTGCTVDGYCGTAIENNGEFTLVLGEGLKKDFFDLYSLSKEKEFILCLSGYKQGKNYFATSYYQPSYMKRDNGKALYNSCKNDSIGTLHNHYNPTNDDYFCQLSARDIYTFGQSNDDLMGIICGEKIIFIHKSDLKPVYLR